MGLDENQKRAEEYFFVNLSGKVGEKWPEYRPGQRLEMVRESQNRKQMLYVLGPCNTKVYFDTITAHEIMNMEANGISYSCYFVKYHDNGVLQVLLCRTDGMFRPEDLLM